VLVEAFSLRGLGRLAEAWEKDPPFASDNAFRNRNCRISREYYSGVSVLADKQGFTRDPATWFARHRNQPEADRNSQEPRLAVLDEYERTPSCIEALGALNRWPAVLASPNHNYFRRKDLRRSLTVETLLGDDDFLPAITQILPFAGVKPTAEPSIELKVCIPLVRVVGGKSDFAEFDDVLPIRIEVDAREV
jgi:hypothetical protein